MSPFHLFRLHIKVLSNLDHCSSHTKPKSTTNHPPPRLNLPVEILQEIFYHSCFFSLSQFAHEPPLKPLPHITRSNLCLVCKSWNAIITDTALLWSQILFTSSLPSQTQLSRFLRVSKSSSLELYINFSGLTESGRDRFSLLLPILYPHVSRLRTIMAIEFSYWRPQLNLLLQHIFPVDRYHSLDQLRTFQLCGDAHAKQSFSRIGTAMTPNLTTLTLPAYHEWILDTFCDLSNLRQVDICLKEEGLQRLERISGCPALECLSLRLRPNDAFLFFPSIRFPRLTTLNLDIHADVALIPGIIQLAKCLYFPSLKDLTLKFTSYGHMEGSCYMEDSALRFLYSLIHHKSPHIETLRLHYIYLTKEVMHDVITYLTQLHTLELFTCRLSPCFFNIFLSPTNSTNTSTDAFPGLDDISLTLRYSDDFLNDLRDFLLKHPKFGKVLKISTRLFTRERDIIQFKILGQIFLALQVDGA